MNDPDFDSELTRARSTYAARDHSSLLASIYQPLLPAPLLTVQEREWQIARMLRRHGLSSLDRLDILDVGCGTGSDLERFSVLGADPTRLAGIDLMESRVERARWRLPHANLHAGSAHVLPFTDRSFDLVTQFTTLSSVLDSQLRQAIAVEMMRVVRSSGFILWYDMSTVRGQRGDLHAISRQEIRNLYPDCTIVFEASTLRWEILRRVAPISRGLSQLLQLVPPLNTHLLALIHRA